MKLPKGVLFDFDGVIVDSFESHYSAWSSAFKALFDKEIPAFPKSYAGKSPMVIAEYFCSTIEQEHHTEHLFLLKDKHLDEFFIVPKLLPGVNEIESYLTDNNIPFGIASNATRQFLKNSIKQLDINFDTFFGVQDYDKPKPSPEAYIKLAKKLGFIPQDYKDLWVFEDSLTGTTAAKLAGMMPIGILTQYSEEELRAAGSVMVFNTLMDAFNVLNDADFVLRER